MDKFLIFGGMALVTCFTRYAMIAALGRELPTLLQRWLKYVPVAVLSALIVPAALAPHGHPQVDSHAWAVLAGAVIAWCTRSVAWTIFGGMIAFWLLQMAGL